MCMSHVTHLDVSHSDLIHVTCINIYRSVCLSTSRFDMHIDVYIYWYKSRVSRAFCPLYVDMSIIIYLCHDSFTHTTNLICMLIQVTCIRSCVSQYVCVCVCVCVCVDTSHVYIHLYAYRSSKSKRIRIYICWYKSRVSSLYITIHVDTGITIYLCHDSFTYATDLIFMLVKVTCIRTCVSLYVLILVTCIYICMPFEAPSRETYEVATISRLLKMIGLFCRI